MISYCTLQTTRVVYALWPESILPVFLSFLPFPLFVMLSREAHVYLSTFWLIFSFSAHLRDATMANIKNVARLCVFTYAAFYLCCVYLMTFYYVDTTGVDRFYGTVLRNPINWQEEYFTLFISLLLNWGFHFEAFRSKKIEYERRAEEQLAVEQLQQQLQRSPTPKQDSEQHLVRQTTDGLLRSGSSALSLGSLKFFIPLEALHFTEQDLVGRGASGLVYKGDFEGETVAIKKLTRDTLSAKEVKILRYSLFSFFSSYFFLPPSSLG